MKLKYKVKQAVYDQNFKDWKEGDVIVFRGLMLADESDRPSLKQYGTQQGFVTTIRSCVEVDNTRGHTHVVHYDEDKMGVYACAFERKRFL